MLFFKITEPKSDSIPAINAKLKELLIPAEINNGFVYYDGEIIYSLQEKKVVKELSFDLSSWVYPRINRIIFLTDM